jgi:ATP-dependent Lon protease
MGIIRNYLDWIIDQPWVEQSEDNLDFNHAIQFWGENHFGLEKAKDRILEYLAVEKLGKGDNHETHFMFRGTTRNGENIFGQIYRPIAWT